jgi:hypothetical protein
MLCIMSAGVLTQQAEASSPPNTGWWRNPSNGHWFYYHNTVMLTGWIKDGNAVYFLRHSANTPGIGPVGSMVIGEFVINGQRREFGPSGACSDNTRPVVLNARILRDPTYNGTAAQARADFLSAVATFEQAWFFDIIFTLHNGNQVANFGGGLNNGRCRLTNPSLCDALCDNVALRDCDGRHHRSSIRIYRELSVSSVYTARIVGHGLCFWDATSRTHERTGGAGGVGGTNYQFHRDTVVTTVNPFAWGIRYLLRHELGHNLGVNNHCTNTCVMNDATEEFNAWCPPCRDTIRRVTMGV